MSKIHLLVCFATLSVVAFDSSSAGAAGGGCRTLYATTSCISNNNGTALPDFYQDSIAGYPTDTWVNVYVQRCYTQNGLRLCYGCPPGFIDYDLGVQCNSRGGSGPIYSGVLRPGHFDRNSATGVRWQIRGWTPGTARTIVEVLSPGGKTVYMWVNSPFVDHT